MSGTAGERRRRATDVATPSRSEDHPASDSARPSLSAVSSRDLLEVVCNNTTSALFIMDECQQCVYMNLAAEKLTGYSLAEVRGRSLHDVIHHTHPDGRPYPLSECPIDQAFPRNNQEHGEEVFVHRDGHFYPVAFTASPVRDGTGIPIGTVIEVQDISERVKEQQRLLASQEYLRSAIDSSAGGFYGVDRDGVTTMCNATFLRLLGFDRLEDVVGKKLHDVVHHTRPDGSHYPKEDCPIYRAARTGVPAHVEDEIFFRRDGTSFPVEYWTRPTLHNGEFSGAVTTFIDITERKAAERALSDARSRLNAALSAGEIGTFVWDVVNDRIYGDPNFAVLFGIDLDPDSAAPLQSFVDVLHPDDRAMVLELIKQSLETGCEYKAEYRIVNRGRERWVSARGKVEHDGNGRVVRFPGVLLDITDRKRAEQARTDISERFERQSRLFAGVASTTPDFIYILDRDGRFRYANRRLLEVWGLEFDDAVGKSLYELGYPQWHADMHMREIADVIETKRAISGEVPFTGGSGIFGVYEYIFAPVLDPDGEVEVIAGTTRDVTVRKQTEQALRNGKELMEVALAASATGTFRFDLTTREFDAFDDNLKRLFGFDPATPVRTPADFLAAVHPDDAAAVTAAVERTIFQAVDFDLEYRVVHPDGSVHWLFDRAKVMRDANGAASYLVGACTDVTRRRASEEAAREAVKRFRFLAETLPQKIFTAHPNGEADYLNEQWGEYSGLPLDALLGWGWMRLIHADDLKANANTWRRSVQTGEPFQVEHRVRAHDGSYHWHLSRVHPMRDASGKVAMWIGSVTDIDELIRTRDALQTSAREREALLDAERAARGQAEAASHLKDEFLATLSHELRTPLTAILGWSQLLRRCADDGVRVAEGLAVIERNTRVQVQLVEDLLDMSRIVSGKLRLDAQRVDLAGVIRAAIDSVAPAAQAKAIRVEPVLSTQVGSVRGDPARLQQVFWNLLSNAIKFTPKGGKVQVGLERVDSHCEITVADTGAGIDAAFLPHVFDRFRQADGAINRTHQGLGLGLSIVKSILEMHGGTVHAKSPGLGLGTTFSVYLPVMVLHDDPRSESGREDPAAPVASVGTDRENTPMLDSVSVLVVDDDRDARDLIRRVLEDSQAKVRVASTAAQALDMLRNDPPHVLVSDIGMPVEDGYALIRRVRELPVREGGDTPAVALTAFARSEDRRRALLAGFHAHISKPVDPAELVTVVASLAGRIGTQRD